MIEDRVYQVENPEKELRYGVYSVQGEVDTGPACLTVIKKYGGYVKKDTIGEPVFKIELMVPAVLDVLVRHITEVIFYREKVIEKIKK